MKKLIRDKYDTIIDESELEICTDTTQLKSYLLNKLDEELLELYQSKYKDVSEYADVLEVIFAIAKMNNISKDEILSRRIEKLYEKGGFEKGLILTR